jgi:predicted amidohydrolase YtcJ
MLIRSAELHRNGRLVDVRIEGERIAEIGDLAPHPGESAIDAKGGALLPGLHDHHIHLSALAARRASVFCGPPAVCDADEMARVLARPGTGWLRATGYHESVLGGLPDAAALDRIVPDRPLRLQHRGGRMWLLNSPALDLLLAESAPPPGLEREGDRFTGRLFDSDTWLQQALASSPPSFDTVSRELAAFGVTGLTDMSPRNDGRIAAHFAAEIRTGALRQGCVLAGALALAYAPQDGWALGPAKLHLHEAALPDFAETVAFIHDAHAQGRGVAVHCVTEVELVFTLALFGEAGTVRGDRIEHVSIASPDHVAQIADLRLWTCLQPHFIAERGDRYLADVDPCHHPDLYRLASLRDAGLVMSGGSDAPFVSPDPWAAMRAAVSRRTSGGECIGPGEALTPEGALDLWLADPANLARTRRIEPGATADLCLLGRPWRSARTHLCAKDVVCAVASGRIVHDLVDKPPFEGAQSGETPA